MLNGIGDGDEADIAAKAVVSLERARARQNAEAAKFDAEDIARVAAPPAPRPRRHAVRKKRRKPRGK